MLKSKPTVQPAQHPDLVVTMARRAHQLEQWAHNAETIAFATGQETPVGKFHLKCRDRWIAEMNAIEDYLTLARCESVEGALVQIMQAFSWASFALFTAAEEDRDPLQRIERLCLSAISLLSAELKIDIEQFGARFYLPTNEPVAPEARP